MCLQEPFESFLMINNPRNSTFRGHCVLKPHFSTTHFFYLTIKRLSDTLLAIKDPCEIFCLSISFPLLFVYGGPIQGLLPLRTLLNPTSDRGSVKIFIINSISKAVEIQTFKGCFLKRRSFNGLPSIEDSSMIISL